jgi:hypothetical protein
MSKKPLGDFPEEKELIPEHIRRFLASLAQWVGWFGAFTVGSTVIICLFVGIVGTLVRSRMRLSQTILAAFRAGVEIQRLRDEKNGNHHHE